MNRNADAVRGKMKLVYENGEVRLPRWASLFSRRNILPTSGLLVAASILKDYNLRFDERVMFGYEDADFFIVHICVVRDYFFWSIHIFLERVAR